MQMPVVICNMVRVENAVLIFEGIALRKVGAYKFRIDRTVHNHMGDMNAERRQFPRHGLREGSQRMFGTGEGCKAGGPSGACGGAGINHGAFSALLHAFGNLAARQDHVHRAGGTDQAGQADRSAINQRHPEAAAEDAEFRRGRDHPQIAPCGQLNPSGDGKAIHRGDDGF